jgi:hypothetical protein
MSKIPVWHKEGWRPAGYKRCICPKCNTVCSTNAYARSKHVCAVIHILVAGFAMCIFTKAVPRDWPTGHKWVGLEERGKATCRDCRRACRSLPIPLVPKGTA